MTENEWRHHVRTLAHDCGWRDFYTHYSPYSTPGWPDLALMRPPTVVLAELKSSKGRVRPEQETTGATLAACDRVLYRLWRPEDLDDVVSVLAPGGRVL